MIVGNQDHLSYFKQLLNLKNMEHVTLDLRVECHLFKF